jgi:hypothetical protein
LAKTTVADPQEPDQDAQNALNAFWKAQKEEKTSTVGPLPASAALRPARCAML